MELNRFFILSAIIFMLFSPVNAQFYEWAKFYGTGIEARSIVVDSKGNSYTAGNFYEPAYFSNIKLTSLGGLDIFIAKYDSSGNIIWAVRAGGALQDDVFGITVDSSDYLYITGYFQGSALFGVHTLISSGFNDIYIAKYDDLGNCVWARQAGGPYNDYGFGISADLNCNVFITGEFRSIANFGTTTLNTSQAKSEIFIAKYDSIGNFIWAKQAGNDSSEDRGHRIINDISGNIYLTGKFSGNSSFDSTQLFSYGGADIYLAKYDSNGNCLWAKQAGGTLSDQGNDVSIDNLGNVYLTGFFTGPSTFGPFQLSGYKNQDIFIAKYDNYGNCLWAKQAGGSIDSDRGTGISTDCYGNSYVTGTFYKSAIFNNYTISSFGSWDIFIAKLDTNGDYIWLKKAGGTSSDNSVDIYADDNGQCFFIGTMESVKVNFGDISLNIGKGSFISKFSLPKLVCTSPIGNEVWQAGTVHNITWQGRYDGKLKIEISTNNGTNWFILRDTISAFYQNYTFPVPPFESPNCRIKITSISYPNTSVMSNLITITNSTTPNITIISPNTPLNWGMGTNRNIEWNTSALTGDIKLEYTTDNGKTWEMIINSYPSSSLTFSWIIPNIPSSTCRVKISSVSNPLVYDISDELFQIDGLYVVSPNGGEFFRAETDVAITWNYLNVENVNIRFSSDAGANWTTIADNVLVTNNSYIWTLPDIDKDSCLIKIVSSNSPLISDESNNIFKIWKPIISNYTPSVGLQSHTFAGTNLSFSAFIISPQPIAVIYYPFQAPYADSLPANIVGFYPYHWQVSSPSISFIDGYISCPIPSVFSTNDSTKLVWLKGSDTNFKWTNLGGLMMSGSLVNTVTFETFSKFAIGICSVTSPSSSKEKEGIPQSYSLYQNYPNPFNPSTVISYQLPVSIKVSLKLYDILGNEVATLVNEEKPAGYHSVTFEAGNLASGIYLYQLTAGEFVSTKKLILVK